MRRDTLLPDMSVKRVHRALVKPLLHPPRAQKSPEQYLGKSEIDWKEVYLTPLKITIESQLRVFQYKFLNNILYLNNRLFKMGYAESPLCSLCKGRFTPSNFGPIIISNFFVYDEKCWRSHDPISQSNYFVMYSRETRQFLF